MGLASILSLQILPLHRRRLHVEEVARIARGRPACVGVRPPFSPAGIPCRWIQSPCALDAILVGRPDKRVVKRHQLADRGLDERGEDADDSVDCLKYLSAFQWLRQPRFEDVRPANDVRLPAEGVARSP